MTMAWKLDDNADPSMSTLLGMVRTLGFRLSVKTG